MLEEKTIALGSSGAELARDMACASGQTSSITLSHLRSASRAASFHACDLPVEAGVGPQMMAVRGEVQPAGIGAEAPRRTAP